MTFVASLSNRSSCIWFWFPLIIASCRAPFQDSWRRSPVDHVKFHSKLRFPMRKAIKTQALLSVLPWISNWDALKVHSMTQEKYDESDPFVPEWHGSTIGGTPTEGTGCGWLAELTTLGARDFSSAVSGFCQVFIVTRAKSLWSRALLLWWHRSNR